MNIKKNALVIVATSLAVIGILLVLIQGAQSKEQFRSTYLDVFDTVTIIIGYENSQEELTEKADLLEEELFRYHKLFDIYNSYNGINNLKTINDNAGLSPVQVDPAIIDLLKFSLELYEETNGQTNIAMGSVLNIWHQYRNHGIDFPEDAMLPPIEILEQASANCNINDIVIDEEASTVYLKNPEMSLDVGSIGKGYAVQKTAEYAESLGYTNMIISVGGNIAIVGEPYKDTPWKFGVQNPDLSSPNVSLCSVKLTDGSLVTSGDYQRYYTVNGKDYCHIIDPDTLMPADYFKSVTIITSDSGVADALSTALFCMTFEEGLAFANSHPDVEAMWVFADGSIQYSENFQSYIN